MDSLFFIYQLKVLRLCATGIDKPDPATKKHLFFLVDTIIQNFKTKQAFAK
ncbi:hypothetical protein [Chryseobacterium sp. CCH4-E10]|uniref:hypothetical protein n=1 Tax=Chryseobacterium sp. CCH4-E10 TaxID=1768758 RepID=UPI000A4312F7|nr:hypothetical protein [Chryseobacterium sp. CCH4-E10]